MDDSTAILVGLAVVVVLIATLMFFVIPEPAQRAIVATDRLDLAVLSFRNSSTWDGVDETVRARVESTLVNEAGINVFSRSQLDSLLAEQMMSESGLIDADTAVEIGFLTGVSKLITGTTLGVDTRADSTTVCLSWENGSCSQEGPGTRYSVQILAQISVVNTQTGLIERSVDATGSDSVTLPAETTFGGFDTLLANAAEEIAVSVRSSLTAAYTRELRYGLFEDFEVKREGFVGKKESTRVSSSDGEIHLIVHFTRAQSGELFDVTWSDSSATFDKQVEDVVSSNDWRLYSLDVSDMTPGRYFVTGFLNGTEVFEIPFTITP
ncbi:CsgG/HfaB family protein [Candidatus Bipolaricaulota bacterium]